jgi:hypothetical protein
MSKFGWVPLRSLSEANAISRPSGAMSYEVASGSAI